MTQSKLRRYLRNCLHLLYFTEAATIGLLFCPLIFPFLIHISSCWKTRFCSFYFVSPLLFLSFSLFFSPYSNEGFLVYIEHNKIGTLCGWWGHLTSVVSKFWCNSFLDYSTSKVCHSFEEMEPLDFGLKSVRPWASSHMFMLPSFNWTMRIKTNLKIWKS